MPEASRHAKPKPAARRVRAASIVAAAALAGVAAATVMLTTNPTGTMPVRYAIPAATTTGAVATADDNTGQTVLAFRHRMAVPSGRAVVRTKSATAPKRHTAPVTAPSAQPTQPASPQPTPTPSAPPVVNGGDAAHSALGVCIRNAEEGGSYAWGPGNGGGAYQFLLGTWEKYGGAASEYGVAGPAYQDQIFDNAVAAGGASNWTAYDGC